MAQFLNFLLDENGGSLYFLKIKTSTLFCLRILQTLSEDENSKSSLYFFLKWEWGHFPIFFFVVYSPYFIWWWEWWKFSILFHNMRMVAVLHTFFKETRMAAFLHSFSEDENRNGAVLHTSFWVWDSEMSGTIIGWSHSESLGTHPLIIYYPRNVERLIYSDTPEMLSKEESEVRYCNCPVNQSWGSRSRSFLNPDILLQWFGFVWEY